MKESAAAPKPPYAPYANAAANEIYNLVFCDDPAAFRPRSGESAAPWQHALFADPVDDAALRALGGDESQEGRVRYLACTRLREHGHAVPEKLLLGVVVEVPLDDGLDMLAAFSEGGVRYVNQTGKLAVFEAMPALQPLVQRLFVASQTIVDRIGPWEGPRRPPPQRDAVRLSFLVSDGLYFGEGPMAALQRDAIAGPVIQRATALLQTIVPLATR